MGINGIFIYNIPPFNKIMNKNISETLYLLSNDARITTKKLGQLLRKSQQNASYLVKSLDRKGIVRNYKAIVDPAMFGLVNVMVLYNYRHFDEEQEEKLLNTALVHPCITRVEEISQGADLMLEFSVPNLSYFNKQHTKLLHRFNNIQISRIYVVIVKHLYPKKYLTTAPDYEEVVICGDRAVEHLRDKQLDVLKILHKNGRETVADMSRTLKQDPKTIVLLKRHLEERQFIMGYRAHLDYTKLGIIRSHIFIRPDHEDPDEVRKILAFCLRHKNIVKTIN